ncbi:sigma-70 family RNA polymerase sigma factor (plasmid) [Streptomyces sp. BH-SS-21]|uniref:Sigma-70 family RNA polymerase sigma factor n=1 Tax=Streptomyces liliiviolaceus TaxID=2823109 RepID=A0A940Y1N1_9ACTN|nr:sigma-70 family RNA polymerase sigma factor [Streptomyces liliiviolaceus]MBQ0855649.1 sigma-70 family RNA polymerase sigma factor [Streptomyces liliiviolaceus]
MAERDRPRSRHAEALAELVAERYDRMVRYAARRLRTRDVPRSSADPEDIVQSALKSVLAHDEPIGNVRAYLYTCMAREIDRAARHHYTGRGYESLDVDVRLEDEPVVCPIADAERRYFIDEALSELPRQQQRAFFLTWELEMTHAQAAEAMGIAAGTIGVHSHRAIKALRVTLAVLGTCLVSWVTCSVVLGKRVVFPGAGAEFTLSASMVVPALSIAVGLISVVVCLVLYLPVRGQLSFRDLVWPVGFPGRRRGSVPEPLSYDEDEAPTDDDLAPDFAEED